MADKRLLQYDFGSLIEKNDPTGEHFGWVAYFTRWGVKAG
jgi:hypothetical protein